MEFSYSYANSAQNREELHNSALWLPLQKWEFVPSRFLNYKPKIFAPHIWDDDTSIFRYVGPEIPLSDRSYRPYDLIPLEGENINEAWRKSLIRAIAKPSVLKMAEHFSRDFKEPLIAISVFRSAEYQQWLWDLGRCNDGNFCAKPGFSEHQLGLGVDFFDATSETQYLSNPRYKAFYEWMKKNAHNYGWTQSYKHWSDIDGYEIEPWHWRYIGVKQATLLYHLDMSYTKFLYKIQFISQL